jgi:glycosyltransferase involved in cell wall biosynthesis
MVNVSIVVTTFNDAENVECFLNGITREQTVKADEIVVVDGGSKDNTVEVLKDYAVKSVVPIRIISDGKRKNISEGINDGIKHSKNEWVMIMGTGNAYNTEFIQMLLKRQEECSAEIIYSSVIGVEKTKFAHVFNQYFLRGNRPQDLYASNHGVLIHKNVFEKIGYFWEHYVYAGEDSEFFARARRMGIECSCVIEASAFWDTPQTFKEYLKKMKVNSIADWQMFDGSHIWRMISIQILALIGYIALSVLNGWFLLLIIPFLILLGVKKKTCNVLSLLLGTINRYVMVFYYIKNRKYAAEEYHVPQELRL